MATPHQAGEQVVHHEHLSDDLSVPLPSSLITLLNIPLTFFYREIFFFLYLNILLFLLSGVHSSSFF